MLNRDYEGGIFTDHDGELHPVPVFTALAWVLGTKPLEMGVSRPGFATKDEILLFSPAFSRWQVQSRQ